MPMTIRKQAAVKGILAIFWVLVLGLLLSPQNLYSEETGFKYFKNYSYREYEHTPQNWGMVQSESGIIYVANHGGVLEFDGVSWRVIGIPEYAPVRSLAIDGTGTIYIGGVGEIGFLKADKNCSLQYVSLMDKLKEDERNFSEVWRTIVTKEGIYFSSFKFLFRWDPKNKKMKVWKADHRFIYPFTVEGTLFIQQENIGIMQIKDDSLELFLGDQQFADANERIFMMVPYNTGSNTPTLLIGTRLKGFYLYDGKTVKPFLTEADDYLKNSIVLHGIRLSSGDFALATRLGGLVVVDSHGRLINIYDKTSGLQDDNVKYLFQDNQENLWLCLDNGISKIEYASPFFLLDNRFSLPNIILSITRYHGGLYAGTTQGLYFLISGSKTFYPVPGITSNCWDLITAGGYLLVATNSGVFQVNNNNNTAEKIINGESFALLPSGRYPGRIWCGTRSGLVALIQKNNRWEEDHRYKTIDQSIRFIAEEKNGNLWLATVTEDVLKVDFTAGIDHPVINSYGIPSGLPGGQVFTTVAAGHVIFATKKGIFRFDDNNNAFVPDKILGSEFAGGPNSPPAFRLIEGPRKNIWFHSKSRNYQAAPGPGGSYTIDSTPFHRIPMTQVNAIYPDPDGKKIWFGSNDGLICYNTTVKKDYRQTFQTLVRKVILNENQKNEKLFFDGGNTQITPEILNTYHIIEYKDRNLHFEFAAPFFEAEEETRYQFILDGYGDDWSKWDIKKQRNYSNLTPGPYTFKVRSKNIYENLGEEAIFEFKILRPWYQAWWAYLLYVSAFLIMTYLTYKWWHSIRLQQEKKKLEILVKERTKEVHEKNQVLETQTMQLKDQSQKLKEMDQVKSRFFANISHEFRTPLTLIMGPIEQMLSEGRDIGQKKILKIMRRSSQRLLTLINQLLDLSRLDSGKMDLQAACQNIVPFLKGTVASFQMVALENQLELEFHSEAGEIPLFFDAPKMEEVMYNLLINAIKFTPPQGKISLSVTVSKEQSDQAKEEADFLYISLRDTGPGISQEQLIHIFDRFYQVEGAGGRGHKGSGIGLALTKEIVLLHHGKIDVHSQEGKGTEFVIQLPLGRDHLKPNQIVSSSEAVPGEGKCKEIEILHTSSGLEEEEEIGRDTGEIEAVGDIETGAYEDRSQPQEKNVILVVEDEPDVREFIRSPLKPFYEVVVAKDGKEGIAIAKEIIPDLIVSDIMMPGTDGYELCRVLKKDIHTSHVPIILLTAKASEESIIQGLETGADDYITKPFNTRMLLNRIKNLIDLRRQLQLKIQRQKMLLPAEISISSPDETFLKEFQGIIEKNLADPEFNVDLLSKKLYMGRSTLFRKIQALTGETPNQFILSYRLERGAQLLREKYGNVTEVALDVGFSSPAYFSKLFKEKFQQTPSDFQASQGPGEKISKPGKE